MPGKFLLKPGCYRAIPLKVANEKVTWPADDSHERSEPPDGFRLTFTGMFATQRTVANARNADNARPASEFKNTELPFPIKENLAQGRSWTPTSTTE